MENLASVVAFLAPVLGALAVSYVRGKSPAASSSSKRTGFRPIKQSDRAKRTVNPIRGVVEKIDKRGNPNKVMIDVSIGTPFALLMCCLLTWCGTGARAADPSAPCVPTADAPGSPLFPHDLCPLPLLLPARVRAV